MRRKTKLITLFLTALFFAAAPVLPCLAGDANSAWPPADAVIMELNGQTQPTDACFGVFTPSKTGYYQIEYNHYAAGFVDAPEEGKAADGTAISCVGEYRVWQNADMDVYGECYYLLSADESYYFSLRAGSLYTVSEYGEDHCLFDGFLLDSAYVEHTIRGDLAVKVNEAVFERQNVPFAVKLNGIYSYAELTNTADSAEHYEFEYVKGQPASFVLPSIANGSSYRLKVYGFADESTVVLNETFYFRQESWEPPSITLSLDTPVVPEEYSTGVFTPDETGYYVFAVSKGATVWQGMQTSTDFTDFSSCLNFGAFYSDEGNNYYVYSLTAEESYYMELYEDATYTVSRYTTEEGIRLTGIEFVCGESILCEAYYEINGASLTVALTDELAQAADILMLLDFSKPFSKAILTDSGGATHEQSDGSSVTLPHIEDGDTYTMKVYGYAEPESVTVQYTVTFSSELADAATVRVGDMLFYPYTLDEETIRSYEAESYLGSSAAVEISSEVNGLPVECIDDSCFEGNETLVSVKIPPCVDGIGNRAFANCTALKDISIERVGVENEDVYWMGSSVFEGCTSLVFAAFPEGLYSIPDAAFRGCTSLKYVSLPESMRSIGHYDEEQNSFAGCTSLESIVIPENVYQIGYSSFAGCTSLKKVIFEGDAPTLSAEADYEANADEALLNDFTFYNCSSELTLYYAEDSDDFSTPEWHGYPCYAMRRVEIQPPADGYTYDSLFIDGVEYDKKTIDGTLIADFPGEAPKTATTYKMRNGIPCGMRVFLLNYDEQGGCTAEEVSEFEDLLSYHGFSVRITGNTGIRFKTGVNMELKEELLSSAGVSGFKLKEYGTVVMNEANTAFLPLVKNGEKTRSGIAYGLGEDNVFYNAVFESKEGRDRFTSVLVNLPPAQYKTYFVFRGYMILEKAGIEYTVYGPSVSRSIYGVSQQVIDSGQFAAGSASDTYLRRIISDADSL